MEEKNKTIERLTEKRNNFLSEGETTLPINVNENEIKTKNYKFNNLLISSAERIIYKSKGEEKNRWKFYEIKDMDNFKLIGNKKEENKDRKEEEVDINKFVSELKTTKKVLIETVGRIDENLSEMKRYLKKDDVEFKDRFIMKMKEFNGVVSEMKEKIKESIEITMERIKKEMEEKKKGHEEYLKDKIQKDEIIIKEHELNCKIKIEELTLEIDKWKNKADSINSQISIKDNMINNLQETIKRKTEENMKQTKIIKNYESTYH